MVLLLLLLTDGVFYIRGATHHSVAVEFRDHVVVVEGPLNEQRSLAVIAEVKKLIPNKPIRYLVNIPSWTAATDPNRAPRAGLCVLRTACRVGSRLSFCAPWRDALPGWSRSSPRIAISAASDPSVDTPDTGAWAMTEAPDTRNGVRTRSIHIRKSAYFFAIKAEWFPESWQKPFRCNATQ